MATKPIEDIWTNITGAGTVADGGYVGDLLTIARAHIEDAIANNEITQEDAGAVFVQMIPSAFQNGIGTASVLEETRILSNKT